MKITIKSLIIFMFCYVSTEVFAATSSDYAWSNCRCYPNHLTCPSGFVLNGQISGTSGLMPPHRCCSNDCFAGGRMEICRRSGAPNIGNSGLGAPYFSCQEGYCSGSIDGQGWDNYTNC